jgi:beta-N-acetylhexosaminidase
MSLGASGDERLANELGRITALEARAAGVHVVFAPVVDVNNNPGEPDHQHAQLRRGPRHSCRGWLRRTCAGCRTTASIATVKHFPGHGDTGTDSHIDLPFIGVDRARADAVELPPYREAFRAGAGAVMTAHIAFPR